MSDLTFERACELFEYDPKTGQFFWKIRVNSASTPGTIAGGYDKRGYRRLSVKKKFYQAHRIAWLIFYGRMPKLELDHVNGVPDDNRIANLREATRAQNQHNVKRRTDNKSGFKGVCWHKSTKRWRAEIRINGKPRTLGDFHSPEDAHAAYCKAANELHGEFANHG